MQWNVTVPCIITIGEMIAETEAMSKNTDIISDNSSSQGLFVHLHHDVPCDVAWFFRMAWIPRLT